LIGENHASVKGQIQLAELLGRLYDRNAIDAILIEGSHGPIDTASPTDGTEDSQQTNQHWKDELAWGRLAAYEYVALTRPRTIVFGIEDLGAQARFAAASAGKDFIASTQWQLEGSQRAASLFDEAALRLGGRNRVVNSEVANYKQLVSREQLLQNHLTSGSRAQALLSKITAGQREMARLAVKLRPFQLLISQVQASIHANDNAKATELSQSVETLMLESNYDEASLQHDFASLNILYVDLKQSSDELSKLVSPFKSAHEDTVDQFCITANTLREQGEAHQLSFPAVESFFADESARLKKMADSVIGKADLAERDQKMNESVQAYFQSSGKKSVAMIVGYAHLESAEAGLRAAGISYIAGALPSAYDDLEPWEEPAWEKRHEPIERVFSTSIRI